MEAYTQTPAGHPPAARALSDERARPPDAAGAVTALYEAHAVGFIRLAVVMLGFIVVVSLWTPMLNPTFSEHWFGWPGILLTSPVPILVALVALLFWRGLSRQDQMTPLLCAQAWFVLCYAGLGISLWPMIVPPGITIWDAAAPASSLEFLLVGAVVLVPVILGYTGYAYWVFRGKVRPGMHYH